MTLEEVNKAIADTNCLIEIASVNLPNTYRHLNKNLQKLINLHEKLATEDVKVLDKEKQI